MTLQQIALRDKLKQGSDTFKEIESLRAYIKENEKIQSGAHNPDIQKLLEEQNEELIRKYNQLISIRSKIDRCINTINDTDLRTVMTMRYLGHVNTFTIAEKMYCGRNTVNRKHKAALNAIIESGADKLLDY